MSKILRDARYAILDFKHIHAVSKDGLNIASTDPAAIADTVGGTNWVVITKKDVAEALAPLDGLRTFLIVGLI